MPTYSLTVETLERAMKESKRHHEQRDNQYDEARFPFHGSITLDIESVDLEELKQDKRAGIYLIWEKKGGRAYVGMTANFSYRFYHGKPDHKHNCVRCTCHGHINATPRTCRSHIIINSPNGFNVSILQEMEYDPELVCQAEVDWYYILLAHGIEMVNRDYALGNPNFSGMPIVSCNLSTGDYYFFPNQIGASIVCYGKTSGGAGYVDVCAKGRQNQQSGFTHRKATEEEMDLYRGHREISHLISQLPTDVEWRIGAEGRINVDMATSCSGCSDDNESHQRKFRMLWKSGPLSQQDIEHLLGTSRDSYDEEVPQTDYKGVSWDKTAKGWQTRAKKANTSHMKDLWRAGPKKEWKHAWQAALAREKKIISEKWQDFNKGKIGSNARLLNIQLDEKQRGVQVFTDWED